MSLQQENKAQLMRRRWDFSVAFLKPLRHFQKKNSRRFRRDSVTITENTLTRSRTAGWMTRTIKRALTATHSQAEMDHKWTFERKQTYSLSGSHSDTHMGGRGAAETHFNYVSSLPLFCSTRKAQRCQKVGFNTGEHWSLCNCRQHLNFTFLWKSSELWRPRVFKM